CGSAPRRTHLFGWLLMHDDGAGNKIAQSSALLVAHHAYQANAVNAGQSVHGSHQVSTNRFERIDRPAGFFDDSNARVPLPRRLPFPKNFEDREISPII